MMTKNDAYNYASGIHRRVNTSGYSYSRIEADMKSEGYTDEDVLMVKRWLKAWSIGRRYDSVDI